MDALPTSRIAINGNLDGVWPCATGALVATAIIAPKTMPASPISRMGTSVGMAGGSLADLNCGRRAGSSVRLMTAPHVQFIRIILIRGTVPLPTWVALLVESGQR